MLVHNLKALLKKYLETEPPQVNTLKNLKDNALRAKTKLRFHMQL